MAEERYERLGKIRADIASVKKKIEEVQAEYEKKSAKLKQQFDDKKAKLLEILKSHEQRLREEEKAVIFTDVTETNLSPEQLGEFFGVIKSGVLNEQLIALGLDPQIMALICGSNGDKQIEKDVFKGNSAKEVSAEEKVNFEGEAEDEEKERN